MEEKNEINLNQISDLSKIKDIIVNIGNDLEKDIKDIPEIKEENLYYFLFMKDIYNEKGTKIKDKEKFITFSNILNKYFQEGSDFVLLCFQKRNIDLLKIIFNGYISADIKDPEQEKILNSNLKKIFDLFFSRHIIYWVYNKLSKIYRKYNTIENKEDFFNEFSRTFHIWNLLFDIKQKPKIKSNFFSFIGNQVLTIQNNDQKYPFYETDIFIEFDEGILFDDFSIVNVHYTNYGIQTLMSNGILNEKEKKNINNISIRINGYYIGYIFDIDKIKEESERNNFNKIMKFDSSSNFTKIEILKNYIGRIKRIRIMVNLADKEIHKITYSILPSGNEQGYEINCDKDDHKIAIVYFDNKTIYSKIYPELLYEDIGYYGGLECFIPIIKIIKYFMVTFKENQDIINKLNNMLIEITKNIIKIILYSPKNFGNFKKTLTSFLAALAEINHIYPNNLKNDFYSNPTFSLFYILIMTLSLPFSIKKSLMMITGKYNIDKLSMNFEELIIDVEELSAISYRWYATLLIMIIEFILLQYDTLALIPKQLIEQLNKIQKLVIAKDDKSKMYIKYSIQTINYICLEENKENLFENCEEIENFQDFLKQNIINDKQNLELILNMMKIYFNIFNLESYWYKFEEEIPKENEGINEKKKKEKKLYKTIFKNCFNNFENFAAEKNEILEQYIPNFFVEHIANREYLEKLFPFLNNNNFKIEAEIYLSEFIDFHRDYHNLMKNIFIFNEAWSDKKLFFKEEKRSKYLKYEIINYYTTNYQRPFIFPKLDYKISYPNFTKYKVTKNLYIEEENPDDYNFDLDCPELDSFNVDYEEKLIHYIKEKNKMNIFEVCLVKKTNHIKGKMIVCTDNSSRMNKILFISYPKNINNSIPCCNVLVNKKNVNSNKEKLCHGAIFVCPEKYMNIKIFIEVKNIRMILRRIYFYRKSAVEIFTSNKSYLFNFADDSTKNTSKFSEKSCENFINMFGFFISEFFPIIINGDIIGYSRQFLEILENINKNDKNYDNKIGKKFISYLFEHWGTDFDGVEYSTLDLLIFLNLLSNRSYNDLFQYPVFPVLFFYDKSKDNTYHLIDRKLNNHIGFQTVSDRSKQRKNMIQKSYADSKKELQEEEEEEMEDNPSSYFNSHYSTHFYVCNYKIRFFPYTFISIELQGNNFDDPNRLFFSIEDTFYNISCQKGDLRELIPEFYYFPEFFWNINKINLGIRMNGIKVDNVIMPSDPSKIDKDKEKEKKNNNEYEKSNYYLSFKFVEKMRNLLESKQINIIPWINIIFGPGQKYKDPKKKDLYFRKESYIDFSKLRNSDFQNYRGDKTFMTSVEFGMTPVQTVFDGDISNKTKNRSNYYDLKIKDDKEWFRANCKKNLDVINEKIMNNKNQSGEIKTQEKNKTDTNQSQIKSIFLNSEDYIKSIFSNENYRIIGYQTGKVEVLYKKKEIEVPIKISEFFDHQNEVNHINYNQRLNIISTASIDGFINIYILPNKLLTTIKHPNKGSYYQKIYLSSNPFPSIIGIDENNEIFSYSINGFLIKREKIDVLLKIKEKKGEIRIFPHFNMDGGTFKDRLIFAECTTKEKETTYKCHFIKVPLLEEEEKTIDIKYK